MTSYTLERSDDGASVTWLDGGLIFREAGLGRLDWAPADKPDEWQRLRAQDEIAFELEFPKLLMAVRATFLLPLGRVSL